MKKRTFANVWDAIEDTREAAANMRVRADLMIEVQRYVKEKKLTQAEAAKRLGITQPRLNDLLLLSELESGETLLQRTVRAQQLLNLRGLRR